MKRRVTGPGTRVNISVVSARFAAPSLHFLTTAP